MIEILDIKDEDVFGFSIDGKIEKAIWSGFSKLWSKL